MFKRIRRWFDNLMMAFLLPMLPWIILFWLIELGKQAQGEKTKRETSAEELAYLKAAKIVNDVIADGTLAKEQLNARTSAALKNTVPGHAEEALNQAVIDLAAEVEEKRKNAR